MSIGLRIPLKQAPAESTKYTRNVFLYQAPLEPKDDFAQCETCRWWTGAKKQRCAILGKALKADADSSCGLYVHGVPNPDQPIEQSYTPEEAGFVTREVRCENCRAFNPDTRTCGFFQMLNDLMPDKFDLDEKVDPYGCCNANKPKKAAVSVTIQLGVVSPPRSRVGFVRGPKNIGGAP